MGTSNISEIGKVFVQSQTVKAGAPASGEDAQVAFKEVMSQMTNFLGDNLGCGTKLGGGTNGNAVPEAVVSGAEYDKYQYREMEIREDTGRDWSGNDQIREELSKFEEGVKDVLKEELGVTDDQIAEAMETLGLTYVDLMNPNQLAALVAELTGTADVGTLLCNSEFMTVMQTVQELGENLMQELGITAEELDQLLVTTAPEQTEEGAVLNDRAEETRTAEQAVEQTAFSEEVVADAAEEQAGVQTAAAEEESTTDEDFMEEEADASIEEEEFTAEEASVEKEAQETIPKNEGAVREEHTSSGDRQNFFQQNQQNAQANPVAGQSLTEMVMAQGAQSASEFSTQLDVSNIIRQIAEYSRVTIANSATTMEMQLNPENLGKLYLEITSKDGVVSAHITAQNEVVKEALESQIAELRQNLNQAGVKVEAVEVTVGSHEFEKNLEQNAKRDEQQGEQQEKAAKATRRINLNDLDELSGLMTEEESLVAQMMADQGNSVDFTA